MLNPATRRVLLASAAVCMLYLVAAIAVGDDVRAWPSAAAIATALSGLMAAVVHRWSLFVLGALLLVSAAGVALVILYALFASAEWSWSDRFLMVAMALGVIAPLLGVQIWGFSVATQRDHEETI